MLCGGSRVLQHLSDHHHHTSIGFGLGFCGARIVQLSSYFLRPSSQAMKNSNFSHKLHQRMISSSGSHCRTPKDIPILHNCFSQREDDSEIAVEGLSPVAGGIVALGKFDALHIGHRELTIQASRNGTPYLLSFVGMAEVIGWEPRAPIVAKCDRKRVLTSWASHCGNRAPAEYEIEFSSVRHLTPRQFVEKLSKELRVCGVVAGENYRFGYRASGDSSKLVRLCEEYGIRAYIINSVMDKNQFCETVETQEDSKSKERGQVSSTRVRHALAAGDVRYVTELLGRPHRLISRVRIQDITDKGGRISLQTSSLLNLPPGNGVYKACSLIVGDDDEHPVSCKVVVDSLNLHIETEEVRFRNSDGSQEFVLLGIEFG
uniref:FAD synthase n=1 Tax=Noccaea caerulescens TaxID=107243 RepID=A0A1J3CRD8_NOCCA